MIMIMINLIMIHR